MKARKKRKLETVGYKVLDAEEYLGLSEDGAALVEMKVLLTGLMKELRKRKGLSQAELAKLIGSSQTRLAKMEAGDPSISSGLLFRGYWL